MRPGRGAPREAGGRPGGRSTTTTPEGRREAGGGRRAYAARGERGAAVGGAAPGRQAAAGHAAGLRGAGASAGRPHPAAVPPGVSRDPLPHPLGTAGLRQGECLPLPWLELGVGSRPWTLPGFVCEAGGLQRKDSFLCSLFSLITVCYLGFCGDCPLVCT